MTSITPSDQASLVNGLRALADYLEKAPRAPRSAAVMLAPIARENSKAGNEHAIVVCADSGTVTLASAPGTTAVQRDSGPVTWKVTLAPRPGTGGCGK